MVKGDEHGETKTVGRYCGNKVPDLIHVPSHKVSVHFRTDSGITFSGFRLEWLNDGCGGILTHPEGELTSPRYPNLYPISTECNWTIQAAPGYNIELTFVDVDMETVFVECAYDYILVNSENGASMEPKFRFLSGD